MFPAYFACLPGDQAPAFEAFRKQKSCRTRSVQQPFFCANCMPAAFSRSAAHNHLAGLLTHTSGASPASLRSLLGFPMTGFRLCAQTRAYSAGRRLFSFPFPLSAYPKAPASRHKMAVSCYQIHYTVRSDICKVLSCGQACIFLQHLASLARDKAVSAFSKAHLPGQQGGNAAAHQDLARNVQLPRLARFVAAHAKRLLLRPPASTTVTSPVLSAGSVFFSFESVR